MKSFVMLVAVLAALTAAPAVADDGQVPQGTLRALGLGGIQVVSDSQGMQVRGRQSAFVSVSGTSLIFGQLNAGGGNFVVASSVNSVRNNGSSTASGQVTATGTHLALLAGVTLNVTFPDTTTFAGTINGVALGTGTASVNLP